MRRRREEDEEKTKWRPGRDDEEGKVADARVTGQWH
jgi:hypothetical protein